MLGMSPDPAFRPLVAVAAGENEVVLAVSSAIGLALQVLNGGRVAPDMVATGKAQGHEFRRSKSSAPPAPRTAARAGDVAVPYS